MALYYKCGVKTGFTFANQFFMLISVGLSGVTVNVALPKLPINKFKPVVQSRQKVLRVYCADRYMYCALKMDHITDVPAICM